MLLAAALIVNSVAVPGTQLHVKLATQVGRPYDERTLEKDVRWLWSLGRFDDVRVEEPEPGALVFRVTPKQRLVLREVRLTPHSFGIEIRLPPEPPLDYESARAIARGVERQLDARVEEKLVPRGRGMADLHLHVIPRKKKRGAPPEAMRSEISKGVCRDLFRQRDGALEFAARFEFDRGLSAQRGREYRVGRIEFTGNHRYSDGLVRSHMLLDEGDVWDDRLLRRGIARLNRSGLFDPVDERHVLVVRDPNEGIANVTLRLTERKRGSWNIAGPWPFRASIGARLPKIATYAASFTLYGWSRIPVAAIQRPYTPGAGWKSGFAIAPQLGLRGFGIGYAAGQVQQRLIPLISGERSADGPLTIGGDIEAACVAKPRLRLLRTGATAALGFLGTLL